MAWYDDVSSGASWMYDQAETGWNRSVGYARDAAPVVREVTEHPAVVAGVTVLVYAYPPVGVPLATALASANAVARAVESGDPATVAQMAATRAAAESGDPDAARYVALVDEASTWGSASGVSVADELPPSDAAQARALWHETLQERLAATRAASRASAEASGRAAGRAQGRVIAEFTYPSGTVRYLANGRRVAL